MITLMHCDSVDNDLNNCLRMLKLIVPKVSIKDVFILMDNDIKKYLVVGSKGYYIINLWDRCFDSVDIFNVDDNGFINYLRFHDTNIILDDGVVYTFNNKVLNDDMDEDDYYQNYVGCVKSSITVSSIPLVESSFVTYNALINYLEYDFEGSKSLFCRYLYNANFNGFDKITEAYCKMPFHINVLSLKSEDVNKEDKEYFLTHWNNNDKYYGFALMKIIPFMACLDGEIKDSFEFYYDKPVFDEEGNFNFWNHLRSRVYDENDIKRLLLKEGFNLQIPKELIEMYNGENEDFIYAKNVASLLADKGIIKKLVR